jgi:glycosyltransferase involved in cell wall biosynthesis
MPQHENLSLSIVLAVHNEERNLPRCLESVQRLDAEIVIVDGESTDRTAAIARKFGAEVIETTNKQNFHINKQMAIDAASGDLILQLDADEAVDQELIAFIRQLQQTRRPDDDTQPVAWYLRRKNFFLGRWLRKGGQYPDAVIRLFLAGKAELPMEHVHEQLRVHGETGTAEGHLLHFPNPTFSNYLRTSFDRYTTWTAQKLYERELEITLRNSLNYLVWKPSVTFLQLYLRHKGILDGLQGFIFALGSALHHPVAYLKLWERYELERRQEQTEERT